MFKLVVDHGGGYHTGQILQLEKDLGVKLFNRRPFALTPAGESYLEHARAALANESEQKQADTSVAC